MIARAVFGEVDSLAKYVRYGQAVHAEMMRLEFESARRNRPSCGGAMVWMFNDCWPTSNWSIIDYRRREKPSFFAAKRACQPLLPMIVAHGQNIEFFFGNDSLDSRHATVRYGRRSLTGQVAWTRECELDVPANTTIRFDSLPAESLDVSPGDHLFIDARVDGHELPSVAYFPQGWQNIEWPEPRIVIESLSTTPLPNGAWRLRVAVTTDRFARFLHLVTRREESGVTFSDNYFDLNAGACRELTVDSPSPLKASDLVPCHWGIPTCS